jgi:hypothetical protein
MNLRNDEQRIEIVSRERVRFWIHRVLEEKTMHLKRLSEEIGVLNHQAENFDKMPPYEQDKVLEALNAEFATWDWKYRFKMK